MAGLFEDLIPAGADGVTPDGRPRITVRPRGAGLDERARDMAIRTVLGEAAAEPDAGMQAVAAVIRNRVKSGKYGADVPGVVLAPNQFEPWGTPAGRNRMFSYNPESEAYKRAAAAVDAVFNQDADPTGGATHFYSPTSQAALGRQPPSWAQGDPLVIGRHNFYAPEGRVQATPAAATAKPEGGMFDDLVPQQAAGFDARFSGEGFGLPQDAQKLAGALRKNADERIALGEFETFVRDAINTAGLNVPRNIHAWYNSRQNGTPFADEYDRLKSVEEASGRVNPKSSVAGTIAGGLAGAVALPGIGGGATMAARAGRAAITAGLYGAAGELFDSKDPVKASVAGALGGALGLVGAPVAEKIVGLVSNLVARGKSTMRFLNADGTLTVEAANAARQAGINPADLQKVMQAKYAEAFNRKGATPAAAREVAADEFGVRMTPGEATGDFNVIAAEQAMRSGAKGPIAATKAREFYDARPDQITRAKTGIQERLAGGNPLTDNVNDASNLAGAAVRSRAAQAKAGVRKAYREALDMEGSFDDISFIDIGERIRREALKGGEPVVINDKTTPVAASAIQHLDATIGRMRVQDRAQPRSMDAVTAGRHQWPNEPMRVSGAVDSADVVGLNLRGVDQARRELVAFYKSAKASGNAEDIRAMRRILAGFDDELETAIATGLFKGDDAALPALKEARRLNSEYQKAFKPQGRGDSVGRAMEKIVERDATGGEIANMLYGKAAIGEKGDSVKLAANLRRVLGPDSEEWAAIRQGLWMRLTSKPEGVDDFGPQALGNRINAFLNGDGKDMARVMFSPKEIGEMRRFANVMKSIVPPKDATNPSGSAWAIMRELGIGSALGGGTYWWTNDPTMAATVAGVKVGGKLAATLKKGRAAAKHFASGAPVQRPARVNPASIGVSAGLGAGQNDLLE